MTRSQRSRTRRSFLIAMSLAAIAIEAVAGAGLGARSTVVKVNGTDLFCPFDTPAAGGQLFAITRDRTDGGSFAFVDLLVDPTDANAPGLVGGMDDPNLTPSGMQQTFDSPRFDRRHSARHRSPRPSPGLGRSALVGSTRTRCRWGSSRTWSSQEA